MIINGIPMVADIVENKTQFGNYNVVITNIYGFYAYLYPDLSVRRKSRYSTTHGFYQTKEEAKKVIEEFKRKHIMQATDNSSHLRGIIDNALSDFITRREMFTAWDVTKKIRDDNPGTHIFHTVVKDYIHRQFENGYSGFSIAGYSRTTVPIASPPPFCYYIMGVHNPDDYAGDCQLITTASQPVRVNGGIPLPNDGCTVSKVNTISASFGGMRYDSRVPGVRC